MNQACVRNDTIDAGNHHGRPQYRSFLRFLTSQERNVIWLLLAIAFLPVDGTTLGLYAPFWSPISPALFAVYCLCNWRQLRIAANRYLPMFLLPVACIILSIPGWLKFGIHLNAAFMSITGLLGVLATLGAIALAFDIKRIPWRRPLRILIASYWVSFGVGVVQWLSIRLHAKPLTDYFSHLMYRQYISDNSVWGGGRPQFLFAEPSYIGMHLFGILLPLMWLMRGRDRIYAKRLRDLIVTYAVGAVLMQAGTRIVIDSVVALLIALVARTDWHDGARRVRGMLQILGAFALGLLGVLADSRLSAIAENGAEGDGSFFARIYQSLDPICRGQHHQCGVGRRGQSRTAAGRSWHERRRGHGIRGRRERGHGVDDVRVYQRHRRIRADRAGHAGRSLDGLHDAREDGMPWRCGWRIVRRAGARCLCRRRCRG